MEQNHCHGLQTVKMSYSAPFRKHQSLCSYVGSDGRLQLTTRNSTYGCPCLVAPVPIGLYRQLPCVIISQRCEHRLCHFRRSYHKVGVPVGREVQRRRKPRGQPVYTGENARVYGRAQLILPFLRALLAWATALLWAGRMPTQVIHAPLSLPNAICQAGSSDWKNSSGWKKVLRLSAFRILNATRNKRMSCDVVALCARSNVRLRELLGSSKLLDESLPTLVEDSEVGVDDIASELRMRLHVWWIETTQVQRRDGGGGQGAATVTPDRDWRKPH